MKLMMPVRRPDTAPAPEVRGPFWQEAVFLVVVLAIMIGGLWGQSGYTTAPEPGLVVLAVASYLPLFVRTRWPIPVLIIVVAVEVLHLILLPVLGPDAAASAEAVTTASVAAFQPVPVATMAAMYNVALHKEPFTAWLAGLASALTLSGVAFVLYPTNLLATTLIMGNLVIIATAIGTTVRHHRTSTIRRRITQEEHVRAQVLAERMRIARELHDVLAHNLTLVNAQAGVAKFLLPTDPAAAEAALGNITNHTRRAIDDLRATVGLLREEPETPSEPIGKGEVRPAGPGTVQDEDNGVKGVEGAEGATRSALAPTHTLEHLSEMLDSFRSAGNFVHDSQYGAPVRMPQINDLGAYRIIQESLTNAAKHAPGAPIRVDLRWQQSSLDITITNDPPPTTIRDHQRPHRPLGTGHGLIGMRERALTAGGTFEAGALINGGYRVHASIPTT